jgi:hypothetical protein
MIDREIHNELGQCLTGLKIYLLWVNERLSELLEEAESIQPQNRPARDAPEATARPRGGKL